jgi:threonine/homoserine/homoserine lactone efflux protein
MNQAIGQVLSFGVGVAISPIPVIAVVLMLSTPRGRANGPGFLLGWIVGLAAAGTIVLVISGSVDATSSSGPASWVSWLKIALGTAALLLAIKQWRGRPRAGQDAELPSWMKTIDGFTVGRSAATGIALSAINPKNLLLTVGAAAAIAGTGATTGQQTVALTVFVLIGSLGPGIPVAIYFALGERAHRLLDELKAWMGANNAAIMAVLFAVIGAKLVGDGISAL